MREWYKIRWEVINNGPEYLANNATDAIFMVTD
jgi:hypothetical protein